MIFFPFFSVFWFYVGLVGMPNCDDKSYGIPMAFWRFLQMD